MKSFKIICFILLLFPLFELSAVSKDNGNFCQKPFQRDCLALSFLKRTNLKREHSAIGSIESNKKETMSHKKRKRDSNKESLKRKRDSHDEIVDLTKKHRREESQSSNSKQDALRKILSSKPSGRDEEIELHCAAYDGDYEKLQKLIEEGLCWDDRDSHGNTPLHYACLQGHLNVVQLLLKNKVHLNIKNSSQLTALHCAYYCQNFEIFKILVASGTQVGINNNDGNRLLDIAVNDLDYCSAEVLLNSIPVDKINDKNNDGNTLLHRACLSYNTKIVEMLVARGAKCDIQNNYGQTPLHLAVIGANENSIDFINLFLEKKARVDMKNENGETPLDIAFSMGDVPVMEVLLPYCDINAKNHGDGNTLMHRACLLGDIKMVHLLIKYRASLDIQNNYGQTPLHLAIIGANENSLDFINLFLKKKARVDRKDQKGQTPLDIAFSRGDVPAMEVLLPYYDINMQNHRDGNTLMHQACLLGDIEMVNLFITHRASLDIQNNYKQIPLHLAIVIHNEALIELLIPKTVDINHTDRQGKTCLHYFVEAMPFFENSLDLIKLFIKQGVDISIISKDRWTPCGKIFDRCFSDKNDANTVFYPIMEEFLKHCDINKVKMTNRNRWGNTFLHRACLNKSIKMVNLLIKYGLKIDDVNNNGQIPLQIAIISSCESLIKLLILNTVDINHKDDQGETCLHYLLRDKGQLNIADLIRLFIQNGAQIDIEDQNGFSPLEKAFVQSNLTVMEALIPYFDINKKNLRDGNTFMHRACLLGNIEMVNLFIKYRAILKIQNKKNQTLLHLAIVSRNQALIKLLLPETVDINHKDYDGRTYLHYLLDNLENDKNFLDLVKLFIDKGSNVDIKDTSGESSFDKVFRRNLYDIMEVLVPNLEVNKKKDAIGNTLLHCACLRGSIQMVWVLINAGASVDISNSRGQRPLHLAILSGNEELVKILVSKTKDINYQYKVGKTYLHYLLDNVKKFKNSLDLVKLFIEKGSKVDIKDNEGESPWDKASIMEMYPVMKEFVQSLNVNESQEENLCMKEFVQCLDVNESQEENLYLYRACMNGDFKRVTRLVKDDVSVNSPNAQGQLPLHLAILSGNEELVRFLVPKTENINHTDNEGRTCLHDFLDNVEKFKNSLDLVKLFIKKGSKVDIKDKRGESPCDNAFDRSLYPIMEVFVNHFDVNKKKNVRENTLLYCSYLKANIEMFHGLINDYDSVDIEDDKRQIPFGQTLLHLACMNGDFKMMQILIDAGAKLHIENDSSQNLLHMAVCINSNNQDKDLIISFLLTHNVSLDGQDQWGRTPLHYCSLYEGRRKACQLLIDAGANLEIDDINGETPLLVSMCTHNEKIACILLESGADINHSNNFGKSIFNSPFYLNVWSRSFKPETKFNGVQAISPFICQSFHLLDCLSKDKKQDILMEYFLFSKSCVASKFLDKLSELSKYLSDIRSDYNQLQEIVSDCSHHCRPVRDLKNISFHYNVTEYIHLKNAQGIPILHQICRSSDLQTLRAFLNAGFDINETDKKGNNVLMDAIEHGNIEMVNELIKSEYQVYINHQNRDGNTAVHLACLVNSTSDENHSSSKNFERSNLLQSLVDAEASCDIENNKGELPLHCISVNGTVACVNIVLDHSDLSSINSQDNQGNTPLYNAFSSKNMCVGVIFLEHKGDMFIKQDLLPSLIANDDLKEKNPYLFYYFEELDRFARTLKKACTEKDIQKVIELLESKKCLVNFSDQDNKTLLHQACEDGDVNMVKLFLNNGCSIERQDDFGKTPLHYICSRKDRGTVKSDFEILTLLIKHGENIDIVDHENQTPLWYACFVAKRIDMIDSLIQKGANPFVKESEGGTMIDLFLSDETLRNDSHWKPLMTKFEEMKETGSLFKEACLDNNVQEVKKIWSSNKTIVEHFLNQEGEDLLKMALNKKWLNLMIFLLKFDCVKNIINKKHSNGQTLLHLACSIPNLSIAKCLIENGASVNRQDCDGNTPLHFAFLSNSMPFINYLQVCGAIHIVNDSGESPLIYACQKGQIKTIKYFIKNNKDTLSLPHNNRQFALKRTCSVGQVKVLRYLVEKQNCSLDFPEDEGHKGKSLLQKACVDEQLKVLEYLIEEQNCSLAFPEDAGHKGKSLLQKACVDEQLKVLEYLVEEKNCSLDFPEDEGHKGKSLLKRACSGGHLNVFKFLVEEQNCSLDFPEDEGHKGKSLLQKACSGGHMKVLKYLVENQGCLLSFREDAEDRGKSLLKLACSHGHVKVLEYLVEEKEYSLNFQEDKEDRGKSLLKLACSHGYVKVLEYLIENQGCSLYFPEDHKDRHRGKSLLKRACSDGYVDVLQYLVENQGCLLSFREDAEDRGKSLLKLACSCGHVKVLEYLIEKQCCSLSFQEDDRDRGKSLLKSACFDGYVDVLQYLVENQGCLLNFQEKDGDRGKSLWKIACSSNHVDVLEYLVRSEHVHGKMMETMILDQEQAQSA